MILAEVCVINASISLLLAEKSNDSVLINKPFAYGNRGYLWLASSFILSYFKSLIFLSFLAKGRTNIDLQRGFYNDVRPINAHDSMETFTKSRSASNRASPVTVAGEISYYNRYSGTPGPITKVRSIWNINFSRLFEIIISKSDKVASTDKGEN